jgi:hypothetical protein
MVGYAHPWWIAGGCAIDAFTGRRREHADLDVAFFSRDLDALRHHLAHLHLWSAGRGALRPLNDTHPTLHEGARQVWVRENAQSPWLLDLLATDDAAGRWVSARDPSFTAALDEVTWVAANGVRFLDADIVLAYKAKLGRPKDDEDFHATWPLLSERAQDRLRAFLAEHHPDHPWLATIDGTGTT